MISPTSRELSTPKVAERGGGAHGPLEAAAHPLVGVAAPRWSDRRRGRPPRVSSSTVSWPCQGRSSCRTISAPVRADDRQWILRRSSPVRYSRVDASSAPCAPIEWLPASSPTSSERGGSAMRSALDDRRDDDLARRGERAAHVDEVERVGQPDVQRPGAVAAARQAGHPVGHRAVLAAVQPVQRRSGRCRGSGWAAGPRASASRSAAASGW